MLVPGCSARLQPGKPQDQLFGLTLSPPECGVSSASSVPSGGTGSVAGASGAAIGSIGAGAGAGVGSTGAGAGAGMGAGVGVGAGVACFESHAASVPHSMMATSASFIRCMTNPLSLSLNPEFPRPAMHVERMLQAALHSGPSGRLCTRWCASAAAATPVAAMAAPTNAAIASHAICGSRHAGDCSLRCCQGSCRCHGSSHKCCLHYCRDSCRCHGSSHKCCLRFCRGSCRCHGSSHKC